MRLNRILNLCWFMLFGSSSCSWQHVCVCVCFTYPETNLMWAERRMIHMLIRTAWAGSCFQYYILPWVASGVCAGGVRTPWINTPGLLFEWHLMPCTRTRTNFRFNRNRVSHPAETGSENEWLSTILSGCGSRLCYHRCRMEQREN